MQNIELIEPIFAKKTWGNNQAIVDFLGKDPGFKDTVGEIFLASGLPEEIGGSTKIGNKTLREIYADEKNREKWFGKAFINTDEFPFLLKFLAVSEPLSLQVHPADEMRGNKRIPGKTEGWWALNDSKVLCGFKKGFTKEDFTELIKDGFFEQKHTVADLENFMNLVELKKGEAIYVESGTVHTILEGNLLEPQQPSNTTFRIYDWGRNKPDRPLHLGKALDVINCSSRPQKVKGRGEFFDKPNFRIEHLRLNGKLKKELELDRFHIVLSIKNPIKLTAHGSLFTIPRGQCALIMANTGTIDLKAETGTDVFIALAK